MKQRRQTGLKEACDNVQATPDKQKKERATLPVRLWERVMWSFLEEVTRYCEGCVGVRQVDKAGEKAIN